MQRASFQQGSVVRKHRANGPDAWVIRYMDGDVQRSKILGILDKFPTKSDARKNAADLLREINDRNAGIKVSGLCDRFKRECEKEDVELRPHSIATYKSFLRRVRDQWGELRVDDLAGDILALEKWVNGFHIYKFEGTGDQWAALWIRLDVCACLGTNVHIADRCTPGDASGSN